MAVTSAIRDELKRWIYEQENGFSAQLLQDFCFPTDNDLSYYDLGLPAACTRNPDRTFVVVGLRNDVADAVIDLCERGDISFKLTPNPALAVMFEPRIRTEPLITSGNMNKLARDGWVLMQVCRGVDMEGGRWHWSGDERNAYNFKWETTAM